MNDQQELNTTNTNTTTSITTKLKNISFSEIYTFSTCPYKHYLTYIEKQPKQDTIYTVFGTLVHKCIEDKSFDKGYCLEKLTKFITENPEDQYAGKLVADEWLNKIERIYTDFQVWLNDTFPGHELVGNELKLLFPVGPAHQFIGYVDYVIKDKDGYIHLIDFKTTRNGWFKKEKSNTKKLYQVILYKYFYSKLFDVPEKNIMCHYLLMKRSPPKTKSSVELYSITSGPKKVKNCIDWLDKTMKMINLKVRVKNESTCEFCICKK